MTPEEFKVITNYIYTMCGISLGTEKEYLIKQRLEPVAEEFGCKDLTDFINLIQSKKYDSTLREKVVCAITTNETSFFRDISPFSAFENSILPTLVDWVVERKSRAVVRRGAKAQIWSAASSTGQEAYSIAMLIYEYLSTHTSIAQPEDFLITGTDISSEVLAKAISGEYSSIDIKRGLTQVRLNNHFDEVNKKWHIKPHLRSFVEFRPINLIQSFTHLGAFDVIFCRNVLIYFDNETKKKILEQMYQMLAPKGYLLLGSAESMYGICDCFESLSVNGAIVYQKKE